MLIVNEEESAVAYCKHFIKERLQSKCDFDAFPACSTDSKYLVLYCGGTEQMSVSYHFTPVKCLTNKIYVRNSIVSIRKWNITSSMCLFKRFLFLILYITLF